MASNTIDSAGGRTDALVAEPSGWVLFAAIMVLFAGIWNVVEGFVGFLRASYFIGSPVFGSLWIWALAWMVFGIVQVAAGAAIMSGRGWGRWFAIVVVALNAFLHLLALGAYPWWSLVMIAIDVLILYALSVHWGRTAAAY
ncbi:MAG TPA: hypothetical protein VOB72_05695 [Candidatus Dormibacteraeota bacterium]|nr:hypothetical protein [Candidatus Dormibacteraeota bacterium]